MSSNENENHEVWTEKYRPKDFNEILGQEDIVKRVQAFVKKKNLPNLLFSGPPGVGKTTLALVIARKLYGENWRENLLELNASDERGIDIIRVKVKDFARTKALSDVLFKLVYLDESDALTKEAQQALRRVMEDFTRTCRFILSCNYSSKIIEPIQSRCAVFRFSPLKAEDIKNRLRYIAKNEGKNITEDALDAIVYICNGDMRKAINILQMSAAISDTIDESIVYKATGLAKREDVESVVKKALSGDFIAARNKLNKLLVELGLSGEDIIKQIHRVIYDLPIEDRLKVELLDRTGEIEFRIVEGANERIQLDALLAYFTLAGEKMKK